MAKFINPDMTDSDLNYLKNNATRFMIGTAGPTTYALGTQYAVGTLAVASGNFTVAAGDAANSRKITFAAATVTVGTTGTVTDLYFIGTAGSGTLLLSGTCAPTAVTATGTVITSAWDCNEIGTIT